MAGPDGRLGAGLHHRVLRRARGSGRGRRGLGLGPLLAAPIGTLSKGQRKRAMLAIGLLTPQPVLLVDEPFDGSTCGRTRERRDPAAHAARGPHADPVDPPDSRRGTRLRSVRAAERRPRVRRGHARRVVAAARGSAPVAATSKRCSLRSPSAPVAWLLAKEWRELMASRAWWLMLLLTGPLVGVSLHQRGRHLRGAERAQRNGGRRRRGLFPARSASGRRRSARTRSSPRSSCPSSRSVWSPGIGRAGALKLELQRRCRRSRASAQRRCVLLAGWLIASRAAVIAIALWTKLRRARLCARDRRRRPRSHAQRRPRRLRGRGGGVDDRASVNGGDPHSRRHGRHVGDQLRRPPCTADCGSGWPAYTPPAMVPTFQHGLVRARRGARRPPDRAPGSALAAIWIASASPSRRRMFESLAVVRAAGLAIVASTLRRRAGTRRRAATIRSPARTRTRSDASALRCASRSTWRRRIRAAWNWSGTRSPNCAARCQRSQVQLRSASVHRAVRADRPGLRRDLVRARRQAARSAAPPTAEGVLETIYDLAGLTPPRRSDGDVFRGHPLAAPPRGAALVFYVLWPALVAGAALPRHSGGNMKTSRSAPLSSLAVVLAAAPSMARRHQGRSRARNRSASRRRRSSPWSARGSSRRTARTRSIKRRRQAVEGPPGQPDAPADRDRAPAVRHLERGADGQREAVRLLPRRGPEGRRHSRTARSA